MLNSTVRGGRYIVWNEPGALLIEVVEKIEECASQRRNTERNGSIDCAMIYSCANPELGVLTRITKHLFFAGKHHCGGSIKQLRHVKFMSAMASAVIPSFPLAGQNLP
jgi:hypothetical protein